MFLKAKKQESSKKVLNQKDATNLHTVNFPVIYIMESYGTDGDGSNRDVFLDILTNSQGLRPYYTRTRCSINHNLQIYEEERNGTPRLKAGDDMHRTMEPYCWNPNDSCCIL